LRPRLSLVIESRMSSITKSPKKVAQAAYRTAKFALPDYAHQYSPKKFTQPQLFVCLVLKIFYKTDYRGIAAILEDNSDLRKVINLKTVPHFTTLQKASKKLLCSVVADRLLKAIVDMVIENGIIDLAAVDSTGFETGYTSRYFARRRAQGGKTDHVVSCKRWPKLGVVCDCENHLILSATTTRGPSVDVNQFRETLEPALQKVRIKKILADAGYDSQGNHEYARDEKNIESIIPAKAGRPTKYGLPLKGKYRQLMRTDFDKEIYGQRWQVETVFSMMKRNFGSAVRARHYWSQCREMMLMVLTHNLAVILFVKELFYRADLVCSVEKL
jgi:transposase